MKKQTASAFITVLFALMSLFLLTACPAEKHQYQQIMEEEESLIEDEEVFEEEEDEDFYEVEEEENLYEVELKDSLDLGTLQK